MKQFLTTMACLALCAALLTGCGGSPSAGTTASPGGNFAADTDNAEDSGKATLAGETAQLLPQDGRKIIYNASLSLESKSFETAREALLEAAAKAGGYLQNSDEGGNSEMGTRWVNYTFRIPSEQYGAFLNSASGTGNLLSKSESTEDVTAEYVDIEARLESLNTQEARLLELAGQAEKLEDLLAIEEQLTQVRYQIESYTGQRRVYDSLISYSTVTVNLSEVQVLTPVSTSFGSKVAAAFSGSWKNFVEGLQRFLIGLIYALPTLVVLAVIALAVVLVLRAVRKRRPTRPAPVREAKPQTAPAQPMAQSAEKQAPKYGPQE